ncbi:hypothetical protein Bca52824_017811, partial [Brassica carinata]
NPGPPVDDYLSRRDLSRRQLSHFRPPLHSYVLGQKAPLSQSSCPSPIVKPDLPELVLKHHSTARSKSSCYRRVVSLRFVTSSSALLRLTDGSLFTEKFPVPDPPDPPDPRDCTFVEISQPLSPHVKVIVQPTPPFDAAPLYENRTTRSTHPGHGLTRSGGLCVPEASPPPRPVLSLSQLCESLVMYFLSQINPDRSLDINFHCVAMGLRLSSGLDERYGSQYGNIGVHFLSWISVRILSCLIVKSITSPPPHRLFTPVPSESRWYSTETCFVLNQNHIWSLNLLIAINLSHHYSSKASCLSTVCRCTSVQRVHLAQSCDVVLKLPLFIHPSQVHLVSSESLGARAVHARSTSFQTLPFGLINFDSDYFMLVVVTYSGTQRMLPTVLHLFEQDSLVSFVILCV